jgi:Ca-activated chloride channel family protein
MSFGAPFWLWTLLLVPALLAVFVFNTRKSKSLLEKIVAPRLLAQLAASVSWPARWLRLSLQLAALACVVAALARPRAGYTWEENKGKGRDILIVIDVSKSMLSTDVAPNRLTRAKLAAQDLTNLLQGDRVGVVAFAGDAFLQAPLTADSGAVLDSIQELDTNIIPVGGTNIAEAVRIAADAFGKGESENRAIVLFSDGEEIDADGVAAVQKHADSFRVFTVGVGTANGSLIPLQDGPGGATFVKDENGQFVKSRLDEARLQKLAEAGDGFYTHLENGPTDMKKIVSEGFLKMSEHEIDAKMSRHPIERYQWPLGFGLALLAASLLVNDRRRTPNRAVAKPARVLVSTGMAVFLAMPVIASASSAGMEFYSQQKYKEATDAFQKDLAKRGDLAALNYDLGAAAYKAGDYEKALEAFSKALAGADAKLQPKAEYNLANTLYQRGSGKQEKDAKIKEWRGAIDHY